MEVDPFLIDQINVYELLGREKIVQLSTRFYERVYNDSDSSSDHVAFKTLFDGRPIEHSIQNQYEFFIERFGGPPLYSQRKGHPALRMRHRDFAVTSRMAEVWLEHMDEALKDVGIEGEAREALWQFLHHVAYFLRNTTD